MRKILMAGVVVLAVFVAVFRDRIYIRDPLGSVQRDGVAVAGVRVYINYSNDVLLEETTVPRFVLVQGWSKAPGIPQHLACVMGMACWTDADHATVSVLSRAESAGETEMSAREVKFLEEAGAEVTVKLR